MVPKHPSRAEEGPWCRYPCNPGQTKATACRLLLGGLNLRLAICLRFALLFRSAHFLYLLLLHALTKVVLHFIKGGSFQVAYVVHLDDVIAKVGLHRRSCTGPSAEFSTRLQKVEQRADGPNRDPRCFPLEPVSLTFPYNLAKSPPFFNCSMIAFASSSFSTRHVTGLVFLSPAILFEFHTPPSAAAATGLFFTYLYICISQNLLLAHGNAGRDVDFLEPFLAASWDTSSSRTS